jgi:hypothetical protein
MTAKGLLTRLTFSLVLVGGMTPWAMSQTRQVNPRPVWYRIWTPYLYGPNTYPYLGPIAPYAPGFFPLDSWYWYEPPLFSPPRYNPALPGSVPAPWQVPAPDWYYRQPYGPYAYPPPFYGGYNVPGPYQSYYWYFYTQPWNRPGWHGDLRIFARPNSQAPTEVPRGQ